MMEEHKTTTVSILGCGWYGLPMAQALLAKGFSVKGSTTTIEKLVVLEKTGVKPFLIDTENINQDDDFFKCDLLIISIPPKANTAELPYADKIRNITKAAESIGIKQIILISSTGIYQDGNFIVDESVVPQPNTPVGEALKAAEEILNGNNTFTTTIIRFAGLIGPNRNLAKHFAGKTDIANGLAPINLIHLDDCIGLTLEIIKQNAFGKVYHGVTPNHPSRKNFYTEACAASGFELPYFRPELLNWKQVESKNVSEVLAYEYVFNDWNKYFKELAL